MFPRNPTCCVELYPGLWPLAAEAVEAARKLDKVADDRRAFAVGDSRLGKGESSPR